MGAHGRPRHLLGVGEVGDADAGLTLDLHQQQDIEGRQAGLGGLLAQAPADPQQGRAQQLGELVGVVGEVGGHGRHLVK